MSGFLTGGGGAAPSAASVPVDASGFSNNLSATDDDVQAALATLDAMTAGGGGATGFLECLGRTIDVFATTAAGIDAIVTSADGRYVGLAHVARSNTWTTPANARYTIPTGKSGTIVAQSAIKLDISYDAARVQDLTASSTWSVMQATTYQSGEYYQGLGGMCSGGDGAGDPSMKQMVAGHEYALQVNGSPGNDGASRSCGAWVILAVFDLPG